MYTKFYSRLKLQKEGRLDHLYHIATGVTPPGLYGYKKNNLGKEKCLIKDSKKLNIILIKKRYPKAIAIELDQQLKQLGFNSNLIFLSLNDFFKKIKIGDFDAALFSFGLSESPIKNFDMFYKKNNIFPLSQYLVEENYKNLERIRARTLLGQEIDLLQKKANENARIVPLLFEKSIGLLNTCLVSMAKTSNSSNQLEGFKVSRRVNCED